MASGGRELQRNPGSFIATWIAIAISVAFVVVASVATATEQNAVGRQLTLGLAKADLVVNVTSRQQNPQAGVLDGARAEQAFKTVGGVSSVDHIPVSPIVFTKNGKSVEARAISLPTNGLPMPSDAPAQGMWPTDGSQVVLNAPTAQALGVQLNDTLDAAVGRAIGAPRTMRVVGITDDANTLVGGVAWVTKTWFVGVRQQDDPNGDYAVVLTPGTDRNGLMASLQTVIALPDYTVQVRTLDQAVTAAADRQTGSAALWRTLLWVFAGIAVVVGIVTIANTYAMSLARRRRDIALLRAIGADADQVRRSMILEALFVGVVGSLLGVVLGIGAAAVVEAATGALARGLVIDWVQVVGAFLLGVVVAVAAAVVPAWDVTRVSPIEALQPVPSSERAFRARRSRTLFVGVAVVLGAVGVGASFVMPPAGGMSMLVAIAGCALLALGILVAARWYVPAIIRTIGVRVKGAAPVFRLAVRNLVRNPRRTAATATALMLAAGLIVGLQVTMTSVRDTVLSQIDTLQPVSVRVTYDEPNHANPTTMPLALAQQLLAVPGVENSAILAGVVVIDDQRHPWTALGYTSDAMAVALDAPQVIANDEALVNPAAWPASRGDKITLTAGATSSTFTVTPSTLVAPGQVLLAASMLQTFGTPHERVALWMSVPDRAQASAVASAVRSIVAGDLHVDLSGAAFDVGSIQDTMFLAMGVATLLLAVAVVIALVGLGNTLLLSVIERERESALLRAHGMSGRDLRRMLLVEALLVGAVATVLGIVAGIGFGVIGLFATLHSMGEAISPVFGIDWVMTVALLVVMGVATVLASIIPGRRAAKAEPIEVLANVG